MDKEEILINEFVKSCNEMIDGKFILADNKIANILNNIASSKQIFNLLSDCVENFNFSKEFARAKVKSPTKAGTFILPDKKEVLLPLVFCLLVEIENGTLDFRTFLNDFFATEVNGLTGYSRFSKEVIQPFKLAIQNSVEFASNNLTQQKKENNLEIKQENAFVNSKEEKYVKDVLRVVFEMLSVLDSEGKKINVEVKDDAKYVLGALKFACENKSIKFVNALIISVEYLTMQIKCFRFLSHELKGLMVDFYS
ncbi:MAG: hypothetical protein RR140_00930 [Clostridia bacterium]